MYAFYFASSFAAFSRRSSSLISLKEFARLPLIGRRYWCKRRYYGRVAIIVIFCAEHAVQHALAFLYVTLSFLTPAYARVSCTLWCHYVYIYRNVMISCVLIDTTVFLHSHPHASHIRVLMLTHVRTEALLLARIQLEGSNQLPKPALHDLQQKAMLTHQNYTFECIT